MWIAMTALDDRLKSRNPSSTQYYKHAVPNLTPTILHMSEELSDTHTRTHRIVYAEEIKSVLEVKHPPTQI
jgi:hypothetical protein